LDLIYLNIKMLSTKEIFFLNTVANSPTSQVNPIPTGALVVKQEEGCSDACREEIQKAVNAALLKKSTTPVVSSNSSAKEYFVPFGTGYVASRDWYDVPGLEANIDGSAYGKVKTATFEVSVRVPTGNQTAEVRLYNVTAKHPVWSSEVMFTGGGTPQFLVSKPITIDPGNNLYKVQMKTQLEFPAYIDQSRVHIITN
jgi:hypothetical protein